MNSELMKLYREQKANPVAGCLPLIAQIPVFFALYYMLFVTIEMRHAPFFGWIDDLSAPDPMTFITAFGFLDWPVPEFLLVGIWPLVFGATMWLQMKLNPQPMEPIQQKIMMALPIIFLFLFARFPAGLVVYWTWNNVLSIGQQWLIMRRMGITRKSLAEDAEKIKKIKESAEKGTLLKPSRSTRKRPARSGEAGAKARAGGDRDARRDGAARRDGDARRDGAKRRDGDARRDGAARRDEDAHRDGTPRRKDAPRRKPGAATAAGGKQTRSKGTARDRSDRPEKARDEAPPTKRAAAARAKPPRRKPAPRKPRRKPASRRRPTARTPTSLMDRVQALLGLEKLAPASTPEPAREEPARKSRRQRKAERAARSGAGSDDRTDTRTDDNTRTDTPTDTMADDADPAGDGDVPAPDASAGTSSDGGEWTSQDRARPRRPKARKRARRR